MRLSGTDTGGVNVFYKKKERNVVHFPYFQLPRVRRRRIRPRCWRPVQMNLSSGSLQIFSEDARLIDTVPLHLDEQLSKIYVDDSEDGVFYVIKLLR